MSGFRLSRIIICIVFALTLPWTAQAESRIPFELPPKDKLANIRSAVIETSKGTIYLELFPSDAPWHVANFKYLADQGFYRNLPFHLYYPGFIIQGGAPHGDANAGPGYSLPAEFNSLTHERGTLGMARVMDQLNPERRSSGSQFHILLSTASHMNGSYTIFGRVAKGMDVVDKLRAGDKIRDVIVYVRK